MASGKPIGSFYVQLGLNTKEFQKNLKGAERELKQAFGPAAIRTSEMLAAAMAGLAVAAGAVAAASVKLAADLERQQVAFTRLMGSSEAAKQRLKELQEFASNTPYTFTELVEYEKRLQALGFAASETRELLTTIGDAASGLGMGADGVGRIIKAFGDIRAKGYLQTQEIRQLAEAGIPAFEILARKMGVSIPEAMDLIESRSVSATVALTALTEGINAKFGGMMALQSQTMLGMFSTIQDEAENTMRIIGSQIEQSAGLKSFVQQVRDAASAFREDLEDRGFISAFSSLLGEKAKFAIVVTAGAITGALIPAVVALKIALMGALLPLTKIVAMGAVISATGYAVYKAWDRFGATIKGSITSIPEMFNSIYYLGASAIEKLVSLASRLMADIFNSLFSYASNSSNQITQSLAPLFADMALWSAQTAANMQKQSTESMNLAASYGDLAGEIHKIYQTEKAIADFTDWTGVENFNQLWERGESTVNRVAATIKSMAAPLASFAKNVTGQGKNASAARATPTGGNSGKSEAEKLAEEARQTSDSIYQDYISQTQGKAAMLDYQYRKELDNLEKTKAHNKNYKRDMLMLDEVYYRRKVELAKEAQEAETKTVVKLAQSRANYTKEQIENEWAQAEAHYERIQALQDGSALEAQLQADSQAADLESYMQHLNAKTAAERAYLEGRRNLISVYDQLMMDANRSSADYMAESYRTVYSGLTEALTSVITGAKNAGEAFKQLGMEIIQMVVRSMIQQKLAAVMSKSIQVSATAASVAQAAAITAAWAPAAAMINAATFGAAAAAGATATAGAVSMMGAMARVMSPVPFANGGIVTKPTLAMIGEGGESEAVIPLSRLGSIGGGANVQLNVINQSGVPVNAKSSQRMDGGKVIIDLFLEGYGRNVSGIQDIIGRRS